MTFKNALKTKDFVVSGHLDLSKIPDAKALRREAGILREAVDALHVSESRSPQMSALAAASVLLQEGIDPVMHVNCRDRNRLAMEKELHGAAVLGVTSILVAHGDKIRQSANLKVQNVFDVSVLGYMTYIHEQLEKRQPPFDADMLIGANAEVFRPGDSWTPRNLTHKADAGARFVQTQICLDVSVVRDYMTSIAASRLTHRVSFIFALVPLPSADAARWVRDNVKSSVVPDSIIERLEQSSNPQQEGIGICAELMHELATVPGVSGVTLQSFGNVEDVAAVLELSDLRR